MRGAIARRQILLRRTARTRDGDENPNVNILDATPLRSPFGNGNRIRTGSPLSIIRTDPISSWIVSAIP